MCNCYESQCTESTELPVDYKWRKIFQFGDRLEGILSFRRTNQKRIGSDRRFKRMMADVENDV